MEGVLVRSPVSVRSRVALRKGLALRGCAALGSAAEPGGSRSATVAALRSALDRALTEHLDEALQDAADELAVDFTAKRLPGTQTAPGPAAQAAEGQCRLLSGAVHVVRRSGGREILHLGNLHTPETEILHLGDLLRHVLFS